jgi:hypothetical protein
LILNCHRDPRAYKAELTEEVRVEAMKAVQQAEEELTMLKLRSDRKHVLEIGSGTDQHAAYFAPELPHLIWQASDVAENLPGIRQWVSDLNVDKHWPKLDVNAVFSANTCHITSWPQVEWMFEGIGKIRTLKTFRLYGPFNYGGKHTSESNARFDASCVPATRRAACATSKASMRSPRRRG